MPFSIDTKMCGLNLIKILCCEALTAVLICKPKCTKKKVCLVLFTLLHGLVALARILCSHCMCVVWWLPLYLLWYLISLIVRVPSFTHAQDSFSFLSLLMTCPYDMSSIMLLSYCSLFSDDDVSFMFHSILRQSIVAADHFLIVLWWRVPKLCHPLCFSSYSYADALIRPVLLWWCKRLFLHFSLGF